MTTGCSKMLDIMFLKATLMKQIQYFPATNLCKMYE